MMETQIMYDTVPFLDSPLARERARKVGNIGSLLMEQGCLTAANVEHVLRLQKGQPLQFGEAAHRLGLVLDSDIQQALARQFHFTSLVPGQGRYSDQLIAAYEPFHPSVIALRSLRNQLSQQGYGRSRKTLAVVGVDDTACSSVLAANLAIVFAQLDRQVLLIDANLRYQRQQSLFKCGPRVGLADILAARASAEALVRIEPFSLSVLAAGTLAPNPDELMGRGVFNEFHASVSQKFDLILIDSCGFCAQAEAMPMAGRLDGAIVVARRDHTRFSDLAETGARLKQAGVPVAGSVLLDS